MSVVFGQYSREIYYKQTKENITYSNIKTNLKEPKLIKLLINIYEIEQSISKKKLILLIKNNLLTYLEAKLINLSN